MSDDGNVILELDRIERGAALSSFSDTRNRLIKQGRPTDTINELILKVAKAREARRDGRDEGR